MTDNPIDLCLQANQSYQQVIRTQLQQIEEQLQENESQQQRLMEFQVALASIGSHHPIIDRRPSLAKFVDSDHDRPPDNEDTLSKAKMKDKMPLIFKIRKWTETESKNLASAVKYQNRQFLLEQASARFNRSRQTAGES